MTKSKKRDILTGVEIGTSMIKVVMGEFVQDDVLAIVGTGAVPSLKVRKGEVTDAPVVQEQLARAVNMAELSCGMEIEGDLFLAVTGAHIKSVNSIGNTLVQSPDGRITEEDRITATRTATAYNLPPDREILHTFDRFFRIDDSREVASPEGLVGAKLEADVHIVFGQRNRLETTCRMLADVMGERPATDIAFSGLAAAFAAFGPEEREKGALVIDIGAGVTEYAVFHGAGCCHSGQITVGCEHFANDLSIGLRLPYANCRKALVDFGSAEVTAAGSSRIMSVSILGKQPRQVPVAAIEQILELRVRELFECIREDLKKARVLGRIGGGAVLCGGGACLKNIDKLARRVLEVPVSIGRPRLVNGEEDIIQSPVWMTPVGLLRYGKFMIDIGATPPVPWHTFVRDEIRGMVRLIGKSLKW